MKLGSRTIGSAHPPYVIAEVGSNHNGDMGLCRRLIDAAADAGADAVKFQSWSETSLISEPEYQANTEYSDKKKHFGSLREMVRKYQLTPDQHRDVARYCAQSRIAFCSSAFSEDEADLLDDLGVPFFKTASMDINNLPLLKHVARKRRPVVMSTGMASLGEIEAAVHAVRKEGNDEIVLLHCIALYPPAMEIINLRNLPMLEMAFGVPVGFSDHSIGVHVPLAAVALGACMIEKHFTLDKDMEGWDHVISADPNELRQIVHQGREVHAALGTTRREVSAAEIEKRKKFRRSAVARRSMGAGHVLSEGDITFKRPGTGVPPEQLQTLVGRALVRAVVQDELLVPELLGG
jgi:N,N'-diacetyllegionaminate synthase